MLHYGAPIPHDEAARLRTLRACGLLDAPAPERFDHYVNLARRITGTPIALLGLMDRDHLQIKASEGLDQQQLPRKHSFCAHAILSEQPFVVRDARADPRFAASSLVRGAPGIRFYAACPLIATNGSRLGTLAVMDTVPREADAETVRTLQDLAALAAGDLAGFQHAAIDHDTGLPNRPGFETMASQALATVQRLNRPSTLVVAGIRGANRSDPLQAEDVRETADLLQGTFRESDIFGRIRTDKLCALLTGTGAVDAIACMRRLENAVAARNLVAGGRHALSVQLGMTTCRPSEHTTLQELLAEAQDSLERGSWAARAVTAG